VICDRQTNGQTDQRLLWRAPGWERNAMAQCNGYCLLAGLEDLTRSIVA